MQKDGPISNNDNAILKTEDFVQLAFNAAANQIRCILYDYVQKNYGNHTTWFKKASQSIPEFDKEVARILSDQDAAHFDRLKIYVETTLAPQFNASYFSIGASTLRQSLEKASSQFPSHAEISRNYQALSSKDKQTLSIETKRMFNQFEEHIKRIKEKNTFEFEDLNEGTRKLAIF